MTDIIKEKIKEEKIMKTLILNGSPHKNGDTAYMVSKIKEKLDGEFEEIYLYDENIKPCIDCRYCWKQEGCSIKDGMEKIYKDNYDVLILASPVYMYNMTPPMFNMVTRLNWIWSNQYFLNKEIVFKKKRGILVLAGGGSGEPRHALDMAKLVFKFLNADFDMEKDYIYSLHTNEIPAKEDKQIEEMIKKL
mgnify:CR=1 FL=1